MIGLPAELSDAHLATGGVRDLLRHVEAREGLSGFRAVQRGVPHAGCSLDLLQHPARLPIDPFAELHARNVYRERYTGQARLQLSPQQPPGIGIWPWYIRRGRLPG